jgi:tetratricopeptide (TPR) repeat protein
MRRSLLVIAIVLTHPANASALDFQTTHRCITKSSPSMEALAKDCTAVINSKDTNQTTHSIAYIHRGHVYIHQGKFDSAIEDFSQSISRIRSAIAFNGRGIAYLKKGALDSAMPDFNEALKIKPDFVDGLIMRGLANAQRTDYAGALQDLDHAVKLSPKRADTLYSRSLVKREKGDTAGADQDLAIARSINPDIGKK